MSALLQEHFSLLDGDRENDLYGPHIPLTTLAPWITATELWGEPYVRREGEALSIWAVLSWDPSEYDRTPFAMPCFRLPRTMWPDRAHEVESDWRNPYRLRLEPSGYVYCEAV